MFSCIARKTIQRVPFRGLASASSAASKTGYREKTFYEAWCSDVGAYPVMSVIGIAILFSAGTGLYFMATSPDARVSKKRRSSIFRGDVVDSNEEETH